MKRYLRLIRILPPGDLARKGVAKPVRAVRLRIEARQARRRRWEITDAELLAAMELEVESVEALARYFKGRRGPDLFRPLDEGFVTQLALRYPGGVAEARREARCICRHEFTLAGSGPTSTRS